MNVGGNLFKIDTESLTESIATSPAAVLETKKSMEQKPSRSVKEYVPLIKFLGPRQFKTKKPILPFAPIIPIKVTSQSGLQIIHYESIEQLPSRYRYRPISEKEASVIEVRFIHLVWRRTLGSLVY